MRLYSPLHMTLHMNKHISCQASHSGSNWLAHLSHFRCPGLNYPFPSITFCCKPANFFPACRIFSGFAGAGVAVFYLIAVFPRVLPGAGDTLRGGNAGGG